VVCGGFREWVDGTRRPQKGVLSLVFIGGFRSSKSLFVSTFFSSKAAAFRRYLDTMTSSIVLSNLPRLFLLGDAAR
jgi:hypothetical protein